MLGRIGSELTQNVLDFVKIIHLSSGFEQEFDTFVGTFDGLWNLINILRFNHGF